jgi:integrase
MNIYRQNYKGKDGNPVKTTKHYIEFLDHNKLRHKLPAFADKRVSEAFGRNIESLINCRLSGLEHDVKLNQWLETLPSSLLRKFTAWGLIDGQRAEFTKPLSEHISDYVKIIKAKDFSADYIRRMKNRLSKIMQDCRFYYFRDITKSAVEIYLGKLKKDEYSTTSRNHYLDALRTFLNWAQTDGRILNNPLAKFEKEARNSKRKGILTPEQFIHLVKNTFGENVLIGNISGQQRAVLYMLAGTTGLRRNELLNLIWNDINLSANNPFVKVRACIAKNGKEALQPIPLIAVSLLTALKAYIKPKDTDRVFQAFGKSINTAGLIRSDLTAATIPLIDRDENEICFHSLRNSYISYLANSQTPAKVVQKLARHSDFRMTYDVYARVLPETEQKAISFLPDFENVFGEKSLCVSLCKPVLQAGISGSNGEHEKRYNGLKVPFAAVITLPPRGIEPLLPG